MYNFKMVQPKSFEYFHVWLGAKQRTRS